MITTLVASATEVLAQNIGDVSPTAPGGGAGDKILELLSWLSWICIIGAVGGLTVCGAKLAVAKVSGGNENGAGLVWGLAGSILIGAAAGLVNMLVL
ncbi:hypothetical protein CH298_26445 [Rhodococcoides fascians]|uniref:hypothetical protein n=1 Tax=Rhodococcoides fascians TaxID=1828 RepID=UPI000B9A2CD6|nr:hypothetical protein [Rhodococcus fascians]OZE80116.1 hypothetical protein CH303_28160 [Rhodococcus fascians]OZF10500.1 hypothetical protein CH298_26445 [Rhodococcus fascians]OZF12353.1 hypothetical protein CH297_27760 [Rhodococcus fascians]OZF60446.1 hypothetical protein CH308_26450 [Rhodococcus fascians]OZF61927.1 hypothetical protein CH307_26640 [Rhodococcus fascians]